MSRWIGMSPFVLFALIIVPVVAFSAFKAIKTRSVMKQYAKDNGWAFKNIDNRQSIPGPPFSSTEPGCCQDVVTGSLQGQSFVTFEYEPPDRNGDAHRRAAVVVIKLPRFLPNLEVAPEGALARAMPHMNQSDPVVQLESSEFNDVFRVSSSIPKFGSDIVTPPLMQYLLGAPRIYWRIWGDNLLGWTLERLSPSETLKILSVLVQVQRQIPSFVWDMYGSTASAAITPTGNGAAVTASAGVAPPAGWYTDPSDAQQARWWDGAGWTPRIASIRPR
jgi:hypothetical protein